MAARTQYVTVSKDAEPLVGVAENHTIARERTFPVGGSLDAITEILRHEKATGKFSVDINCGGICTIRFREEQRITPE